MTWTDWSDKNPYDIALRPDSAGELDDVVVRNVSMFRAEAMDERSWWTCCYFAGTDERLVINFHVRGRRLEAYVTERPEGFTYEAGSLGEAS